MSRNAFTVVQISDLHLDPALPETVARVRELRPLIARLAPDFIVASGDLSANGHLHPAELEYVRAEFDTYPCPVYAIPGNHDVGEAGSTDPVTDAHLARFASCFGADRFCARRGGWSLIGINSLRVSSQLDAEQEQYDWLDERLDSAEEAGRQVALFLHQPPYLNKPDDLFQDHSDYWSVKLPGRHEMLQRLQRRHVRLWANGHVHWYRNIVTAERSWVWCPTVSMVVDDAKFPPGGDVLGVMVYRFDDAGFASELVELDVPKRTYLFRRPEVALPENVAGGGAVSIAHVVLDYDGALSDNGALTAGVAERLTRLARVTRVTLLTADTSGQVEDALADLPVTVATVQTGQDKARRVKDLELPMQGESTSAGLPGAVVALGTTWDDVPMLEAAAIGTAVVGPQGADPELTRAAQVVVGDIGEALDLLLEPERLEQILQD